jgi:hypothetical protein
MTKPLRRFLDLLPLLNRGQFVDRLDDEVRAALDALAGEDKATAVLTIKLTFQKLGDRIDIRPAVSAKLPEPEALSATPFWPLGDALSVQHPSQADMFAGPRTIPDRETA